jgi:hypothetical protein
MIHKTFPSNLLFLNKKFTISSTDLLVLHAGSYIHG